MNHGTVKIETARRGRLALAAFMVRKEEIDTALARLQQLSDDHFGVDPDEVTWGDVTPLVDYADLLKRITDRAFNEGGHAPA